MVGHSRDERCRAKGTHVTNPSKRELARQESSEETNPFFYKEKLVCTLVLSEQNGLSAFVYLGLYSKKSDC